MALLGPGISASFKAGNGRGRVAGGKANLRIIGLSKLQSDFKRMQTKSDSVVTRFIHKAADSIAQLANREVPVDTGRLLKSINVEKFTRGAVVKVDAPYAAYVEGRDNQGIPRGRNPQPFFFKHFEKAERIMLENIKRKI